MKKAVFLDAGTFGLGFSFDPLKTLPLEWTFFDETAPHEVMERLRGAAIVITNKVKLSKETIQRLPDLKLIAVIATGVDCVDVAAAKESGISVCNVTGYSTGTVPQLTILLILSLANSFLSYTADVQKGRWQRHPHFCFLDYPIQEVRGKTLGILGYGNLGKEVARIARALGMKVLIVSHKALAETLPLEQVLKKADFFTIHTPLTQATRNLIGERELSLMKKSAYLINVSRGGIVNEPALAKALREGIIAGAALDVLTEEPPSSTHPLLDPTIPHLILTPHIGWASHEARGTLLETTKGNIEAFLAGAPKNLV
ncbi:MAG: D-2-hydroxyacid dehydrogenase [Verrucomicrobia bacterium]|nr:D-2-hydroxyacid dehydrogenase [Verrucomicrobiota bacterium]